MANRIEVPPELVGTPEQQIRHLRSYLFRVVERLNVTLEELERKASSSDSGNKKE